jgi:GT2 family glycosyltransferase
VPPTDRKEEVDLSILIVNYNTRELLRTCLESIIAETLGINYEIVVIDNNSNDGSRELLQQKFPSVRTIYNEGNKGFAAANNQGIKIAKGRYILLLNSDTKVLAGAIQSTLKFMDAHAVSSIVGCKLLNADGSLQPSLMSFPSVWNLFTESFFLYLIFRRTKLFGGYHMTHFKYDTVCPVDVVKGAFMMIRRELFERIGLFDESYFMYTEETDFCYRAKAAGAGIFYYPSAAIIHYGGGSVKNIERLLEQYHSTQVYFLRKNFVGLKRTAAIAIKMAGIALRIPVYFVAGVLTVNRTFLKKSRSCAKVFTKLLVSPAPESGLSQHAW